MQLDARSGASGQLHRPRRPRRHLRRRPSRHLSPRRRRTTAASRGASRSPARSRCHRGRSHRRRRQRRRRRRIRSTRGRSPQNGPTRPPGTDANLPNAPRRRRRDDGLRASRSKDRGGTHRDGRRRRAPKPRRAPSPRRRSTTSSAQRATPLRGSFGSATARSRWSITPTATTTIRRQQ